MSCGTRRDGSNRTTNKTAMPTTLVGPVAGDRETGAEESGRGSPTAARPAERAGEPRGADLTPGANGASALDRLRLPRRPRHGDEHDAEVHHVSAVAAAAAPEQIR